jgi:hypothetical protein
MKAMCSLMLPTVIGISMLDCAASSAVAQTLKDGIVGTWEIVSIVNENKGNKIEPWGSHPMGYFMFDRSGHISLVILKSDIPKFASNNKNTGTDAENKAVVQGTIANYGTYKIDEENHKALVHYIGSTYPNWNGQERTITITGDEMTWVDPATPFGGTGTVALKRAE